MKYPASIENLINMFSKLPTVGPKTAERYVFYLLKQDPELLQQFAQSLAELKEKTTVCKNCLSIAEKNPCSICADKTRDQSIICVVSDSRNLASIEATKQYNGFYHVLGGLINAIEGVKPESLSIKPLQARLKAGSIKEVILALDPTMEGETTALYLAKLIKPYKIKVTRLAKGLPMGADLEYADEMTLANALKYRIDL